MSDQSQEQPQEPHQQQQQSHGVEYLREIGYRHRPAELLPQVFQRYDANQDGMLEFDEFVALVRDIKELFGDSQPEEESLQRRFRRVDMEHQGGIDLKQVLNMFHAEESKRD